MSTKLATLKNLLATLALSAIAFAGCGGGNKTGNVVVVTVSPTGTANSPLGVIVTQSLTLTATVTGATDTNVTWKCTWATRTFDSSGNPKDGTTADCNATTGNIPANSTNTTVVFSAPENVPNPKTITGNNCTDQTKTCLLLVTITATSTADPKKSGTSVLIVDSGISVAISPTTATVPTSSSFQFFANLTNDLQNQGVTWLVTQGSIDLAKGINYPQLATCSPACGSINDQGVYTAPSAVPTTATLTLVATSKADATRFAIGTITIATAGPITYNGISPTVIPQGVASYDLYIFAPGVTSASQVLLTPAGGPSIPFNFGDPRLKILFPIPTTTVTKPTSTGVRIRLDAATLSAATTYTVDVADPTQKVTGGPFKFTVVPVRPSVVASSPDSYVSGSLSGNINLLLEGGYFGPNGNFVQSTFEGNTVSANSANSSSRKLALSFNSSAPNSSQPGLYQISTARTLTPFPDLNNPSITNFSIFPDYSAVTSDSQTVALKSGIGVPVTAGVDGKALTQVTAIDVDQQKGIAAVATIGQNRVDFFQIASGTLTPIGITAPVNVPTSVSINQTLHQVSVVSFKDQSVSVFPIPTAASSTPVSPIATISLLGFIPQQAPTSTNPAPPLPFPYSIGVDSDTNHAVVAYSSSANPTTALVGFLLDLNTGASDCLKISTNPAASPCVSGQVTLPTGQYPQVAVFPHNHTAVVTPGGLGSTTGVNVLQSSKGVNIKNVSVTSGLVTVVTTSDHGLNPASPGTVLIAGVPDGANGVKFNGAFAVQSVINSTIFTYALAVTKNDTAVGSTDSFVYFAAPNLFLGGFSQTTQGVAVNPLTGLVAAADANATGQNGPQINMLNSLDQNVTSINFRAGSAIVNNQSQSFGCTFYTSSCAGAPELLGTTSVAFQPFANMLVSYNGPQNQLSVSNPATQQRYGWVQLAPGPSPVQTSTISVTPTVPPTETAVPVNLTLNGGLGVDWATNQAIVANSSAGTLTLVSLGSGTTALKPVHVTEVLVPSAAPSDPFTLGGVPGANFPQGTLTSTTDLAGVKIFGSGFTGSSTVRLDGATLPGSNISFISNREIGVTIPKSFLAVPHHYALDVIDSGVTSNASDFFVVAAVDLSAICKDSNNNSITKPASVAIADQLGSGVFAPIAVVTNSGCNNAAVIDIAPQLPQYDQTTGNLTGFANNPTFATVLPKLIPTGSSPSGVAVSPRFGVAVVANNGAGTASILDIAGRKSLVPDVTTGSGPIGVAINEGTGAALVANTSANTVSEINLGLLFPPPTTPATTPPTTLTATSIGVDTSPIAVAIDPDRGTNSNGLAVVTALALTSSFPRGVLDSVDIGSTTPAKSTTAATGTVTLTPTGVVFDSSVSPTLFYAVSSSGNLVSSFNPDTGASSSVRVGINPTSLAINPQTGSIMTVNTVTNTISIVETLSSPFKTRRTYGLPGPPPVGITVNQLQTNQVAIDQFLNMAVIVDQAHNRVLLFPMPN